MRDCFRYDLIPPGSTVLCALSGGADSMYLLCRLLEGAEAGGYAVRCAHYDHGLRSTAGRDAQFVRDWCQSRVVPLTVGGGDVAAQARLLGLGVEECARQMRYAFLEETALREGCARIATGHHAGDNAETVLMNLIRGCGLRGLTGIPERRGDIIRPMLAAQRRDIDDYLELHHIPHVEDESNGDLTYTRNRVRRQLMPLLEELNPQAGAHIAAAAARLRADEEELARQGALLARQGQTGPEGTSIPARLLAEAPRPIALRCLGQLLEGEGLSAGAEHLERVLALAGEDGPPVALSLPGGMARRAYGRLSISAEGPAAPLPELPLQMGEQRWGDWRIVSATAVCPAKAYVGPGEFYLTPGEYTIRPRREGDRLRLGPRPTKTVKRLLIDEKVPAPRRDRLPVLADGRGVAALGGFGPHGDCLAQPGGPALYITMTEERET